MRRFVLPCVVALGVLASPAVVRAQATGQIAGNVFDQTGNPLKGIKLVAKSETDIAPKSTYSNDEGGFRMIGLMPGTFDLTASASGLKTVVRKGIRVGVGAAAEEILIMEVETGPVQEVTVVMKAPTINTTAATIQDKFDEDFLDNLPLENKSNIQGILANQVAGAVGDQSSPQIRGGTSSQNSYQLEGFQTNDVNGGRGQQVTQATVASLDISTGGYGAENANAAGSVTNAVTKSGSNKFELELAGWHENSKARFFLDDLDSKTFNMSSLAALNLSGPIIKDRLWFFTTFEGRNSVDSRERDPTGIRLTPPRGSNNSFRSVGKVTLQITSRNKLQAVYIFNRDQNKNTQGSYNYDRDAQRKEDNFDYFGGLIWESILSDNLLFRTQLGAQSYLRDYAPESCRNDPQNCDHISGLRQNDPFYEWQNATYHVVNTSQTLEFKNSLEYTHSSKAIGDHNIKLTARFFGARVENKESTPGDSVYVFQGLDPYSKRTLYVNDPNIEDGRYGWAVSSASSRLLHFSLQDQLKLPKYRYLTITPGVGVMSSQAFDGAGNDIISFTTATPHITAAWDVTHDGRTVLRSSFNHYLDAGNLSVANSVGQTRTRKICKWDPVTRTFSKDCNIDGGVGGHTVGLPCGTDGVGPDGQACTRKLGVPRTWEYTFGGEREVVEGVAIGTDFQYRSFQNPYEDRETNLLWNPTGTGLDPTGSYANGRSRAVFDLETEAAAKRRYIGVVTSVKKREGKFKTNFSYQWSRLEGNVVNGFQNNFLGGPEGGNPAQDFYQYGFLPGDSRHTIRSQATYQINSWLSAGATYNYTSGTPLNLLYFNSVTSRFQDFRARRGFDPGRNINDPNDDFEWRLPDRQDFNFQVRANLKPITKFNAEFWVDALNLLALRTANSVETQDGMFARIVNSRMAPFRLRLNFRIKF